MSRHRRKKKMKRRKNPIAVYNPPRHRLVKLPMRDISILYTRSSGEYLGKGFRHDYHDVDIYGCSDGSILLKNIQGKKLWGTA
jgi:hypothetical protein